MKDRADDAATEVTLNRSDTTVQTGDGTMPVYLVIPEGDAPYPGIVVIQHAGGVDEFVRGMTDRLGQAGFAAAAPDLYHRLGDQDPGNHSRMAQLRDTQVIADVTDTADLLAMHDDVDAGRLGVTGFCMGGRVTYMMAAAEPRFRAAVAYYGGNTRKSWGEGPTPFQRTGDISSPLLFHFGADDSNPSPDDMRSLDAELRRHGKPHEFHSYEGAGHAFMDFTRDERYHEEASDLSWTRTLAWFAKHLK